MEFEQIERIVKEYIKKKSKILGIKLEIVSNKIEEREKLWIFRYRPWKKRGRSLRKSYIGLGPLLIEKVNGRIHQCGTGYPVDYFIDILERDGDLSRVYKDDDEIVKKYINPL